MLAFLFVCLTGFLFGTGDEFWVIVSPTGENNDVKFTRISQNTAIMTAKSIWLNDEKIISMCQYVVPRTSQHGASVMFDDAPVHNKLIESCFHALGRIPIRIYRGATGVKQVGDDSNFNGRKKKFCKKYVADKHLDSNKLCS